MPPNAKPKVCFQEGSVCVMPLSQDKKGNKLFEITADIMLAELHRMGPNVILCIYFKFFILLVFWAAARLKLIRSRNRTHLF